MFKADDRQGMERHRGYVRALQEYGVLYDPDRIIWFHTEDRAVKPFARLRKELEQIGEEIGVKIKCQREEIFDMMHRI